MIFPNLSFILVFLVSAKIITEEEADKLARVLSVELVPHGWRNIKKRIEEVIGREL